MKTAVNYTEKSTESQLILECSQVCISAEGNKRISDILSQSLDWDYIFLIARRNGLLPLISWNLLQKFRHSLPPETKDKLSLFFQKHTQNNLLLTSKLIEIVKILKKANIAVLPFKGPTLAAQAYNNLALRQYVDLDILVKPKHFSDTTEILLENGYIPVSNPNWLKRKALFFTNKKDIVLEQI